MILRRPPCSPILPGLVFALCCCGALVTCADERVWIDAEVNGKPVRLAFDTGASAMILFRKSAEALGLKITEPPKHVRVPTGAVCPGATEECELTWGGSYTARVHFAVFDLPAALGKVSCDGMFSWTLLRKSIIQFNSDTLLFSIHSSLPKQVASWPSFQIRTNSDNLVLEIPGPQTNSGSLLIDTGAAEGVSLAPERWRSWRAANATQPSTVDAYYTPGIGIVVAEEAWARKLSFGPMILTEVPVTEASPVQVEAAMNFGAAGYAATLGLAALKRLDLVIDGPHDRLYFNPAQSAPPAYEHNQLGVAFVPPNLKSRKLLAHVAPGSPAYEAGLRDGDLLLSIDGRDVAKWRDDQNLRIEMTFRESPPGTKVELTVRRRKKILKVNAVLQQILPPPAPPPAQSAHE